MTIYRIIIETSAAKDKTLLQTVPRDYLRDPPLEWLEIFGPKTIKLSLNNTSNIIVYFF
jgi:hypothetical protein